MNCKTATKTSNANSKKSQAKYNHSRKVRPTSTTQPKNNCRLSPQPNTHNNQAVKLTTQTLILHLNYQSNLKNTTLQFQTNTTFSLKKIQLTHIHPLQHHPNTLELRKTLHKTHRQTAHQQPTNNTCPQTSLRTLPVPLPLLCLCRKESP